MLAAKDTSADTGKPQGVVRPIFGQAGTALVGYTIKGAAPGPRAVVSGFEPVAGMAFKRIISLPSLPFIRGELALVYTDRVSTADLGRLGGDGGADAADEVLFLPFRTDADTDPFDQRRAAQEAYWSILGMCTRLGMISGRGVLNRFVEARER